jgi:hypothetical protein
VYECKGCGTFSRSPEENMHKLGCFSTDPLVPELYVRLDAIESDESVEAMARAALNDPGRFVKRRRVAADWGETSYESLVDWQLRAVQSALSALFRGGESDDGLTTAIDEYGVVKARTRRRREADRG